MPFGIGGFNKPSKGNFDVNFSKGLDDANFNKVPDFSLDNAFKFTPKEQQLRSRIRFYDKDSLWSRWRRGYELYTIVQTTLGSFYNERNYRGDYRMYCSFQQYPGVFVPLRLFMFPSSAQETGKHIVVMRDGNGFNFFDYGLPILAVRYLGPLISGTYSQSGTTITVTKQDHGLRVGESVYLNFTTGAAVDATLPIVSATQNSFTCTAAGSLTTGGNINFYLSVNFDDLRWIETRVRLRYLPTAAAFFAGERFADRVIERDPGISSTYSRVGSTVTVTCSSNHGIATGNEVNLNVTSGGVSSGIYTVTVTSPTVFQVTTIDSGSTSGNLIVTRRIQGFRYDDYVGYTAIGTDATTNEIIFQKTDSYGARTVNNKAETVVPAHRGFTVGRFLTTEIRYQCSCQDYTRRDGYNLYDEVLKRRYPVTPITSTKGGQNLDRDGNLIDQRDNVGVFSDLGYITINNFYKLPDYKDKKATSYPNLQYYQLRWCKHIYAAMFSLLHDEGSQPLNLIGKFTQSGDLSVIITCNAHGLTTGTKIQIDVTSGNVLSGQYTISEVIDDNNFVIAYPYKQTTTGYCAINNVKEHEFVGAWLLEPNDKPVGDDLDAFYKNFNKEISTVRENSDRLNMVKQGAKWVGNKEITGNKFQPEDISNFDPQLITMLLTDDIRRDNTGALDRAGTLQNATQRMISIVSKLTNVAPEQLSGTRFGFINQPLINYNFQFQAGILLGGDYLNGSPTEDAATLSTVDCGTYNPLIAQDVVIDAGSY